MDDGKQRGAGWQSGLLVRLGFKGEEESGVNMEERVWQGFRGFEKVEGAAAWDSLLLPGCCLCTHSDPALGCESGICVCWEGPSASSPEPWLLLEGAWHC